MLTGLVQSATISLAHWGVSATVISNNSDKAGPMSSLKTLLIFGALILAFSSNAISGLMHKLNSHTTTATIVERDQTCRIVIRHADKKRTRKRLACADAYAAREADGTGKTRVYKRTYVTLNYTVENGRQVTTRVREKKVGTRGKPIGNQIDVAYSRNTPTLLSKPTSWDDITKRMFSSSWGLIVLLFVWLGYRKLQGIIGRVKESIEAAAKEAQSRQRKGDDILARIEEDFAAATAPNPVPPNPMSQAPSARTPPAPKAPTRAPRRARRKAKPAPIPSTGGVVSKRRRGWFS